MNACTMPGCQTTAGCICDRVSPRPTYVAGTPERQVVYAWAGEIDALQAQIKRLRAALKPFADAASHFSPYDGQMEEKEVSAFFTLAQLRAAAAALSQHNRAGQE